MQHMFGSSSVFVVVTGSFVVVIVSFVVVTVSFVVVTVSFVVTGLKRISGAGSHVKSFS